MEDLSTPGTQLGSITRETVLAQYLDLLTSKFLAMRNLDFHVKEGVKTTLIVIALYAAIITITYLAW